MNKSVKLTLCELKDATIDIGFVGENLYRTVEIDCAEAYEEYPHAAASMTVQPPQEEAYPAVVERVGNSVVWTLTDSDLAQEGDGEFQLAFTSDEIVRRTWIGTFKIHRSIMPTGNAPSGIDDFLTRAGAALTAIPETIDAALEEAKESGEFDGYSPTVEVTDIPGGHRVSITDVNGTTTVDVMNGTDGEDGYSPTVTVTDIEGGHRVSITDVNGTTTVDVMNGTDGEDGYSPTVTVTDIEGGHRVSITDATGTTAFDVMNGATGATPNITIGTVTTGAAGSDAAATMTGTPEDPVLNLTIPRGDPGEVTEAELQVVAEAKADVIREIIDTPAPVMSFADGGNGFPLKMQFRLDPIQDLHGKDAPYPAGGSAQIWDEEWEVGQYNSNNGSKLNASDRIRSKNYIPVTPSTEYYFNISTQFRAFWYDANHDFISHQDYNATVKKWTSPANAYYLTFNTAGAYGKTYNNDISINYPATDTSYHPWKNICPITGHTGFNVYNEAIYDASATPKRSTTFPDPPGTVYGCTITNNGDGTGTLTVCKVEFIPTSVGGTGTASTGVKYISSYLPTGMNAKEESIYNECISSEYKFRAASAPSDSGWFRVQPNIIYIFDDRFTSKATAESILASEKPQFVYELATPVTYTLSMDAITSLLGQNNIWVDNGTMESVEYSADTKLYVSKKIKASQRLMELIVTANHEDEMKASKAYSAGDLLIVNATLYKATTSIANGATLTVGTNVSATTVAAEIAALA